MSTRVVGSPRLRRSLKDLHWICKAESRNSNPAGVTCWLKDLIGDDWDKALAGALADTAAATTALEYHQAIARLAARTNDSHSGRYSTVLNEYFGNAILPFSMRWIEKRAVVNNVAKAGANAGLPAALEYVTK